jgi:Uma2 family endonuclease
MVTTKLMTAGELFTLPDDGYEYELVRGELRKMSPPKPEHGEVTGNAALPLLLYSKQTDLATVFLNDTGFWLERDPDTVRGPDIAVALAANLPPRPWTGYLTVTPALVAEIASPFDRQTDIEEKIADYRRAGVPLIWYLFPETKTVWVDGAGRDRVVLTEADVLDGSDVLPGLAPIPVASLFR